MNPGTSRPALRTRPGHGHRVAVAETGGAEADDKADHPSQKPVALFERPIRNHVYPGEIVFDPFLGSGTTLIAAERSQRRCFGIEIDPRYAQLTIDRWQALTGRRAARLDGR
jgi:DNA modification methylase